MNSNEPIAREGFLPAGGADLFYREIGQGPPIVVLHGGPDFSHRYLLPDMDRLADAYHLIYYDQRGRGQSAPEVAPEEVSIQSEIEDLERVRKHFDLDRIALLGHSWGAVLGLEYAVRYPDRLSHLILMNSAPASHDDYLWYRRERARRSAGDLEELKALASRAAYREGDAETVAAYYRIHFRSSLRRPEDVEKVIAGLRSTFAKAAILKGRAIEDRLREETWVSTEFDLFPRLRELSVPTLVIHGDYDLIPAELASNIARAVPGARFVLLEDCGHFAYLECPDAVRLEIDAFLRSAPA